MLSSIEPTACEPLQGSLPSPVTSAPGPDPRIAGRLSLAAVGLLATGAVALLRRADPNAVGSLLPPCPFHALTGLYCPGCGSTRCLHALVHGDLAQATTMNPLLVVSLPFVAIMLLNAAGWRPRWLAPVIPMLASARLWLWLLLGHALLRNLPWMPFSWLAPGT